MPRPSHPSISVITPTCGRRTLKATLASLSAELAPSDQSLIIGDGPQPRARTLTKALDSRFSYLEYGPTNDTGNSQRQHALPLATGDFLAFLDDDDIFVPGALATVARDVLSVHPDYCHIFAVSGSSLIEGWPGTSKIVPTHWTVGASQLICPNSPEILGSWLEYTQFYIHGTRHPAVLPPNAYRQDWIFVNQTISRNADRVMYHQVPLVILRPHITPEVASAERA